MIVTFNDGKELVVESYSNNGDELWLNLYTDDYNGVKQLVYGADKSDMTLDRGNTSLSFKNCTDITNFSSVVDEMGRDYITVTLKQHQPDVAELLARIAELEAQQR